MIIQQQSWRLDIKNKGAPANNCNLEFKRQFAKTDKLTARLQARLLCNAVHSKAGKRLETLFTKYYVATQGKLVVFVLLTIYRCAMSFYQIHEWQGHQNCFDCHNHPEHHTY